jgi:hypothetical protein
MRDALTRAGRTRCAMLTSAPICISTTRPQTFTLCFVLSVNARLVIFHESIQVSIPLIATVLRRVALAAVVDEL